MKLKRHHLHDCFTFPVFPSRYQVVTLIAVHFLTSVSTSNYNYLSLAISTLHQTCFKPTSFFFFFHLHVQIQKFRSVGPNKELFNLEWHKFPKLHLLSPKHCTMVSTCLLKQAILLIQILNKWHSGPRFQPSKQIYQVKSHTA